MQLRLLSVNVGKVQTIGNEADGTPMRSAIAKQPVPPGMIDVARLGLAGDTQANKLVHGGPDKAVYAYPADNWPWWEENRLVCGPGVFGENLTLEGADETEVHIGDRFAWGDAVLEISQPRSPCRKFLAFTRRDDAGPLMTRSGRCGWYLRVVDEGMAPTNGILTRIVSSDGPPVREIFFAAMDKRTAMVQRAQFAQVPALAEAWRVRLA